MLIKLPISGGRSVKFMRFRTFEKTVNELKSENNTEKKWEEKPNIFIVSNINEHTY